MKKALVIALSALCLSAPAAFATGDGGGTSEFAAQSPNSFPPGFFAGTPEALYQQSVNRYFAQQSQHAAAVAGAPQSNGALHASSTH
jgi:hypothetical protein